MQESVRPVQEFLHWFGAEVSRAPRLFSRKPLVLCNEFSVAMARLLQDFQLVC